MEITNLWMGFRLQIQLQCSRILCMPLQICQVCSNALLCMAAIENIYPILKTLQPVSQTWFILSQPKNHLLLPKGNIWDRISIWRGAWTGVGLQSCKICLSLIIGTTWLVQRVQGPLLLITFSFVSRRINRHNVGVFSTKFVPYCRWS